MKQPIYDVVTVARFWSKVAVTKKLDDCWEWQGATKNKGYGRMHVGDRFLTASRMVWEMANNEPLGERFALHLCDNPKCCNPTHIIAGNNQENSRQAFERGLMKMPKVVGEDNGNAKLSREDAYRIKKRIVAGDRDKPISADFGVSVAMISRIRHGKSWTSIPWPDRT